MKSLREAWCRETSADPDNWTAENPAWGQCAVTALVVQDIFTGTLMRGELSSGGSHYWNRLPSGEDCDLTREQFENPIAFVGVAPAQRNTLLDNPGTLRRYELLKKRLTA